MTSSTPDQPTRPLATRAAPTLLLLVSLAGAYELLARHRADAGWITTDNAFDRLRAHHKAAGGFQGKVGDVQSQGLQ